MFVLLAGLAGVKPGRVLAAILIGCGFRYFGEGRLTLWCGDAAIDHVERHGDQVALALAVLVPVGGLAYVWWRRRRPQSPS